LFFVGGGGGGGGGSGWNGGAWSSGGGGGASGTSCIQMALRIPPNVTYLAINLAKGGAGGVAGALNTIGGNGGNGEVTSIWCPEIVISGPSYLVQLHGGGGGLAAATASIGGNGGSPGAPKFAGAAVAITNAVGTAGNSPATSAGLGGYWLQLGGGSGGGTDNGTIARDGGIANPNAPWMGTTPGGIVGGTSNWRAGGGAGGQTIFNGRIPGYPGQAGTIGLAPYNTPTVPGNGGGGAAGGANAGAPGADGILRIYW
jgi:hypothetical protein